MSVKMIAIAFVITLASAACIARPVPMSGILISAETTELSGWFSARGEWALYPSQNKARYNPYTNNEEEKCVSLVNKTEFPRISFTKFNNKHIIAIGYIVEYDKLADGNSVGDRLLSKKYFDSEPVENFCLRKYVFVVNKIHD